MCKEEAEKHTVNDVGGIETKKRKGKWKECESKKEGGRERETVSANLKIQ